MEFDKSKVYTALNADELKVGNKVYVADELGALKTIVNSNADINVLAAIKGEDYACRFYNGYASYALAYLVEEPAKLKWTDLKVGDVITNGDETAMVTEIDKGCADNAPIFAGHKWFTKSELAKWQKVEGTK